MRRYDKTFVAPGERHAPAHVPLPIVDVTPVWTPTQSQAVDAVSAHDRAKAFAVRVAVFAVIGLLFAGLGVIVYLAMLAVLGLPALSKYDGLLVFLLILAAMAITAAVKLNSTDYQHTTAGLERHRITTAAQVRQAELQAELELRREALQASLALLESKHNE